MKKASTRDVKKTRKGVKKTRLPGVKYREKVFSTERGFAYLGALHGAAPDATGDLSSEAFVRKLRDEW